MKIFVFTTVFAPSVGGIERLTQTLCAEFVALGHEVKVATMTPGDDGFPYPVIRRPSVGEFLRLLRWCDIHMQANVALKHAWPTLFFRRKMFYQHNNAYQRDDGRRSVLDFLKVSLAKRIRGIANSHYTAGRTGAEYVVSNAYSDAVFFDTRPWVDRDKDLVFLGRLVSQKGCDTLLKALGKLRSRGLKPGLTIIGEGPDRDMLDQLCGSLKLDDQVKFVGTLQGSALSQMLNLHRVMVVPSHYEEPFGIVALEGLACGCVPIVSERGGLIDAIGPHGYTFSNGDVGALANAIEEVLVKPEHAQQRLRAVDGHLERFTARVVAEQYIEIFRRKKSAV